MELEPGAEYRKDSLTDAIRELTHVRFRDAFLDKVVRNISSSWARLGYLDGRTFKRRVKVTANPGSVAFACYPAFVCEGQYADGIHKIISSYLSDLDKTSQMGEWVGGYFRSGKSHHLKMLWHLWPNSGFPDGSSARSLVRKLPSDLRALLIELDTPGERDGGLFAAAVSLPRASTDFVRLTILSIVLRAIRE